MSKDIELKLKIDSKSGQASVDKTTKGIKKLGMTGKEAGKKLSSAFTGAAAKLKLFAVGITASTVAIGYMANKVLDQADATAKLADSLGYNIKLMQEYSYAAGLSGVAQGTLNSSMLAFAKRLGEAKAGTGALVTYLKKTDEALLKQLTSTTDVNEALNIFMNALGNVKSSTDRAALASAAFSRAGVAMTVMVKDGSTGLKIMQKEAHALGLVLGDELFRNAEKLNDSMSKVSQVIKILFTKFILTLAPYIDEVVTSMVEWIKRNQELINQKLKAFIIEVKDSIVFLKDNMKLLVIALTAFMAIIAVYMASGIIKFVYAHAAAVVVLTTSIVASSIAFVKAAVAYNTTLAVATAFGANATKLAASISIFGKVILWARNLVIGLGVALATLGAPLIAVTVGVGAAIGTLIYAFKRANKEATELTEQAAKLAKEALVFHKMPEQQTELDTALEDPDKYYGALPYREIEKEIKSMDAMLDAFWARRKAAELKAMEGRAQRMADIIAIEKEVTEELRKAAEEREEIHKEFTDYVKDKNQIILNSTKNMYAAEVIALDDRYDAEVEKWGVTIAGYAAYQAERQELNKKYAEEQIALQGNMLGQLAYGVQRSIEEAESWGETWIRVGSEVNAQLSDSMTNNLWSVIDGTKSAKEAVISYGTETVKWLFDIIMKQTILSMLTKLHGTDSTQASSLAVTGVAAETGAVMTLTTAYYALAAAKMMAGAGGGAAGGYAGAGASSGLGTATAMASGGDVSGGQPYLIGEKGPELFTPKTSGHITPNNELAGGDTNLSITNLIDPAMIGQYLSSRAGKDAVINIIGNNKQTVRRRLL